MNRWLPRSSLKESGYERPTQQWICGRRADGNPCRFGPDQRGRCTAYLQSQCIPRLDGDRWCCTRPEIFGGPCAAGPRPNGSCCHPQSGQTSCCPVLNQRTLRKRIARGAVLLSLGVSLLLLDGRWNTRFVSPGKLSAAHAAIADSGNNGCTACHSAASATPHAWLQHVWNGNSAVAESRLCMACHFVAVDGQQAMAAHSVAGGPKHIVAGAAGSFSLPLSLASLVGPPSRDGNVACATCHQEHLGVEQPLSALDDTRCQACHQYRFDHFGSAHPQFPFTVPGHKPIAFDHTKHRLFFDNDQLECRQCHLSGGRFAVSGRGGFQENCAGCHQQGKKDWHGSQISRQEQILLQLPEMEFDVPVYWPVNAGSTVPVLMWALLLGDDSAQAALEDLFATDEMELDAEPFEWYPEEEQLKPEFADAVKRLIRELVLGDDQALRQRVAKAFNVAPQSSQVSTFVEQLLGSAFSMRAWQQNWLPKLFPASDSRGGQVSDMTSRSRSGKEMSASGWFVDGEEIAVAYKPKGHGDGFLRAWIELLSLSRGHSATGFRSTVREVIDQRLTGSGGTLYKACLNCHIAQLADGARSDAWRAGRKPDQASGFVKFQHDVHFAAIQPDIRCSGCHELNRSGESAVKGDFIPYSVAQCSKCHTVGKADTSCLHCHNYHFVRP